MGQAQLPQQVPLAAFGDQPQAVAAYGALGAAGGGAGHGEVLGSETVQVSVVIGVGDGSASDTPPHLEGALT